MLVLEYAKVKSPFMSNNCTVPFCDKNKTYNRTYCYFHFKEFKQSKLKKFKELLPLWAIKRCEIHGLLKPSKCETHPAYNSQVCKQCRKMKRKPHVLTDKIKLQFRKNNFKFKYGITLEQYHELLKIQNNVCAICLKPDKSKNLAVDHCHQSNKIRGLLCSKCNRALGYFHDDPILLTKAADYLCR